ncbi:MAG: HEAT repeat domain-containing protein [Planctomycetota bacterium]|jgi:HEAT repeat protein
MLLEALSDRDDSVRSAAAIALGKWRVKQAVEPLQRMRQSDRVQPGKEAALLALVLMRDPSLHGYFKEIFEDREEKDRMRGYALLGLGLAGDAQSRDYLFSLLDPKNRRARSILPRADNKRRELLCAAIAGLADARDAALGDRLLAVVRDKRLLPEVRAYALAAVGKVGARQHATAVAGILMGEREKHLRRSAAIALGALAAPEDAQAIKALKRGLVRDRDRIVNHFAALSLGQIGGPAAFAVLKRAYPRANKEARGFYVVALGLCREPGAVPILEKTLRQAADAEDRAAAALALGLREDKRHAAAVRDAFQGTKDWLLMQTAMLSLGILDDKLSAEPIKDVLVHKRDPAVRNSAALSYALIRQWSAVSLFADILATARNFQTLSTIAKVMGLLPNAAAVEPLVRMYKDKSLQRQGRAFAVVALGALGDPERVPILVRLAFDMNYMLRSDPVDQVVSLL